VYNYWKRIKNIRKPLPRGRYPESIQGIRDKTVQLDNVLRTYDLSLSEVAYIGDDINDLACKQKVKDGDGIIVCPADAVSEVKAVADFVSKYNGGCGAVREFIDYLCHS